MSRSKNYQDLLIESLKDKDEAIAYLNAVLDEYKSNNDEESRKLLLTALKNVAEAQGINKLSKKTGLGKEGLSKTFASKASPKLNTITNLIHAMGMDIKFCLPSKC